MNSDFMTLNMYDMYKGLQMFVISSVIVSVSGVILTAGFDVFTADWVAILKQAANIAVISTCSYLVKNILTNSRGETFQGE